ncbi:MAG: alginate export family protein, partial [Candidatus Omnitrophica bacterium]|nr:alginate export family protein [Candidatus Omnitrophota bacterium]
MSKRLIIVLAAIFVVGIASIACAEVQNVKVSGDILVSGVHRSHLTLDDNESVADFGESIDALLSQVRVRVDADLTDNVTATVRLLNERTFGDEADADNNTVRINNSDVSLDLAYMTMKEFLYSPLTLTVGRQNLRFGNGLIIGDPDTNGISDGHNTAARYLPNSLDDLSLRKAFDAIRATLDYDPLVVDIVYSKIDENAVGLDDDTTLIGANA